MSVDVFSYDGPGIRTVYQNNDWLVAIKNWREANDIDQISRLEVHFKTDEQFVLLAGSVVLIHTRDLNNSSEICATKLEPGKVFQVSKGLWFNNVMSKDAKLIYIEAADTKEAPDNSVYRNLTEEQIQQAKERARALL